MIQINIKGGELPKAEIDNYVQYLEGKNPGRTLQYVNIEVDGDFVNLTYELNPEPFERIRRITGYLVGTTDRWNNAKRAEERDRVKHGITA